MTQFNDWPEDAGQDTYDDLDNLGGEYQPRRGFALGIDTLPNGDYDFEIESAALDKINVDRVVRINLKTNLGKTVEWLHWLNKQEGVNRLGADLCVLGFDADKWGTAQGRPLSAEIPKAVQKLK